MESLKSRYTTENGSKHGGPFVPMRAVHSAQNLHSLLPLPHEPPNCTVACSFKWTKNVSVVTCF